MIYYYDLHIHSVLSPCAEAEMTPNNIVNYAILQGLDIIAVTDHNSADNVEAMLECAEGKKILIIPGIEVETSEEIHVVCLFESLQGALIMGEFVKQRLPEIIIREEIFGQQWIMDAKDQLTGKYPVLLISATDITVKEVFNKVKELGGIAIPAHVDRNSYSILSNLGMIPEDLEVQVLEISTCGNVKKLEADFPGINKYPIIKSSDSHRLRDISSRQNSLDSKDGRKQITAKEVIRLICMKGWR